MKDEKELYELKWFDYRALSPEGATKRFCLEYQRAFSMSHMPHSSESLGESKYINIFKGATRLEDWKWFPTMTKLRQLADTYFMKYEDFWEWGFQGALDLGFKSTFPNVFLSKSLKAYILDKGKNYNMRFLRYTDSPFLNPKSYVGHEIQKDYFSYLVAFSKNFLPEKRAAYLRTLIETGRLSKKYLMEIAK
ncbi:MAG: hypothetical protein ABSB79_06805 [Syntrophales bacterium]|jgi:hypothetical protein